MYQIIKYNMYQIIKINRFLLFTITLLFQQAALAQNRTLTVNLHGMKYDSLLISGVDLNNKAQLRRKGTALNDSCWLFSIPDSVYNNWKYFSIVSQYITGNDPTQRIIVSARLIGKDTLKTKLYNFDDRLPVIDAFYLKSHTTKERFVRKRNNENELFEATQIADLFEVKCGEDKDIVLWMKYPNFSFFTGIDDKDLDYNVGLREYVSIVKANPESRFLMIALYNHWGMYHSKEDVEKVFNNFSSKARQSIWGQRIQNYLETKYFSNGILPECNSGKEEPIIRNPAKYTLVLFSASWCGPCIRQIPALKEIYNDLSGKLDMVYISLDESSTVNDWKKLMDKEKIKWRSLIAANKINEISHKYFIRGIPADILVSPGGLMKEIDIREQTEREKLYKILNN
jgi:thiol-disulfide isomerase/thioredoxin